MFVNLYFCKKIHSFSTYLGLQNLCAVRDFHKCFQSLALYKGSEMMEWEGNIYSKYTKYKKYKILKNIRKPIPGPSYSISKRESLSKEVLTITHRLLNRSELGVQCDHSKHHWKRQRIKKDYRIIKVGRNLQDCLVQLSTWHRVSDL